YCYTDARLTRTALELMHELDARTVDFKPTYNGDDAEPESMPGLVPHLLAHWASGIAVGMASSIPSHHAAELIDAALLLIDNRKAEHAEIMELIKGPDLATGGTLVDPKSVIDAAYESGRGAMRVRAKWEKEDAEGRGAWQIVVTEIPYQVQKGKLIEQIAQII